MKLATEPVSEAILKNHPALKAWMYESQKKLLSCECKFVDGEDEGFKNNDKTIVFALPSIGDASNKDNATIHEWIERYLQDMMLACAMMKADGMEIEPLEGLEGYGNIACMWWN